MSCTAQRTAAPRALLVALCAWAIPAAASAEEGLVVSRVGGGVVMMPEPGEFGGAIDWSSDYGITSRFGLIFGTTFLTVPGRRSVGFGLGAKVLPFEWFWRRIYVHASAELLLAWAPGKPVRPDVGLRAGLGYEELLFWGTGVFVELFGALPLELLGTTRIEALTVGATAGLFLEF